MILFKRGKRTHTQQYFRYCRNPPCKTSSDPIIYEYTQVLAWPSAQRCPLRWLPRVPQAPPKGLDSRPSAAPTDPAWARFPSLLPPPRPLYFWRRGAQKYSIFRARGFCCVPQFLGENHKFLVWGDESGHIFGSRGAENIGVRRPPKGLGSSPWAAPWGVGNGARESFQERPGAPTTSGVRRPNGSVTKVLQAGARRDPRI